MNWKVAIAATVLLAVLGGFWYVSAGKEEPSVTYQETKVKKGDISVGFTSDAVVTGDIIAITAPIQDKVTSVKVAVGSSVKAGTVLATFDTTKTDLQYKAAMATFSKAVYERNQIDKTIKPDAYNAAQQVVNSTWTQVQITKNLLDSLSIKSPIAGIVSEISIHAGEVPSANTGSIIKIVKSNSLYLQVHLEESEVSRIDNKTVATVDVGNSKGTVKVVAISPVSVKDSAGYSVYTVNLALPQELQSKVRIGFEGTVSFTTKTVENVLNIPVTAVFRESEKSYVLVKTPEGNTKREVITGFTDGKTTEITEGLSESDIVLIAKK